MAIKLGASSYSWQSGYYLGQTTLEDCISYLHSVGGTGFELIPEQMLPDDNFVRLTDRFVGQWHEWMDKYQMTPTCLDHFNDNNLYHNRMLTVQEQVDTAEDYLIMAKKLGFSVVRVLTTTPFEVLEKVIPLAEEYGVKLGLEIHAPMSMKSQWADKWHEIIDRTGTKYAGFIPDFGIFSKRPFTVLCDNLIHQGANPEIVNYIVKRYSEIMDARINAAIVKKFGMELLKVSDEINALAEEVRKMGAAEKEIQIIYGRYCYDNPQWMVDVLPLIVHVHAKFYDMVEDGKGGYTDPNIDTERAVRVLRDGGYDGYLSSEYEGPFIETLFGGLDPLPLIGENESVRRHQLFLRSILDEKQ